MPAVPQMHLALVGCGAIATSFYAPVLAAGPDWLAGCVVVDPDAERRRTVRQQIPGARDASDHRDVLGEVDAVVVAVPAHLHHPIASDAIAAGVPVLVEKPVAMSGVEADDLVAKAAQAQVALLVNNTRRLYPSNARVHELVTSGAIGEVRSVVQVEGGSFQWPTVTGYYFQPGTRGVLFDRGAHVLDLVCWWMGEPLRARTCQTDSFGGPETVAAAELGGEGRSAAVRMSWLSPLANTFRVAGDNGSIEGDVFDWRTVVVKRGGDTRVERLKTRVAGFTDFAALLLENLAAVSADAAGPIVSAGDVVPSLHLIDELYGVATRFDMPWMAP